MLAIQVVSDDDELSLERVEALGRLLPSMEVFFRHPQDLDLSAGEMKLEHHPIAFEHNGCFFDYALYVADPEPGALPALVCEVLSKVSESHCRFCLFEVSRLCEQGRQEILSLLAEGVQRFVVTDEFQILHTIILSCGTHQIVGDLRNKLLLM
jgi:hypothetical protein